MKEDVDVEDWMSMGMVVEGSSGWHVAFSRVLR